MLAASGSRLAARALCGARGTLVRPFHASSTVADLRTDGGGEAEDFIDVHLDKASRDGARKGASITPHQLLTTKREALSLYRAVWRASFLFVWKNEKGEDWKTLIRESARKEFEAGRHETDPEIINKLLLTGRDYLDQAMQKFHDKRQAIIDEENKKRGAGR